MAKNENIKNTLDETETLKKRQRITKFKKDPQAPKRFKTAFILFSSQKHPEIRMKLGAEQCKDTINVAKIVSEMWRNLSRNERVVWDKLAADDKKRYFIEKTMYTGPWKIPACKRAKKDADAPKRPMSAFLGYAKINRSLVKSENPHLSNKEVSKLLGNKWKAASEKERKSYIETELKEREAYKEAIAKWRSVREEKLEAGRKRREQIVLTAVANGMRTRHDTIESHMTTNYHIQRHVPTSYGCIPSVSHISGPSAMPRQPTYAMPYHASSYSNPYQDGAQFPHGHIDNYWSYNTHASSSSVAHGLSSSYHGSNIYSNERYLQMNISSSEDQQYGNGHEEGSRHNYHQQQSFYCNTYLQGALSYEAPNVPLSDYGANMSNKYHL
eukprot:CAMPEP_0172483448 /NCGR_PEP_ID=MMETSP1066-20121228/10474_1 /TAXON_ID=671091 /ORGANISM="Coscinodiscus wailesii, Strain CCMP2513" /LENGTH=383 /DNA_ID=CAMNT_0013247345 /DNA_START=21 /DNA_END=1172 /DNA_ORIENTATION=-